MNQCTTNDSPPEAKANHTNSLSCIRGVKNGGGCAKLHELCGPVVSIAYKLSWERECLDLSELARLRWIEHWKIERLAEYFETSSTAIKERLRRLKKRPLGKAVAIKSGIIRNR